MSSPLGILCALGAVLHAEVGGWVHLGTPCTSYTWINKGTHARSVAFPEGNQQFSYVQLGDRLANRSALIAMIAYSRGCLWSVENPKNSEIIHSAPFQFLIQWSQCLERSSGFLSAVTRYTVNLGDFGADTMKPVWIYSLDCVGDAFQTPAPREKSSRPAAAPLAKEHLDIWRVPCVKF